MVRVKLYCMPISNARKCICYSWNSCRNSEVIFSLDYCFIVKWKIWSWLNLWLLENDQLKSFWENNCTIIVMKREIPFREQWGRKWFSGIDDDSIEIWTYPLVQFLGNAPYSRDYNVGLRWLLKGGRGSSI